MSGLKIEIFLMYLLVILTIFTAIMAVLHLSGFQKFKTYDHWMAPMLFAITLTMWENFNR